MRLIPSDPDIETLTGRIEKKQIDLQPGFQRGEIWPLTKQQRLIDSILRDWHVPPIHVILESGGELVSVLDGQQRLAAIRDFVKNVFPVDAGIEPWNKEISKYHGYFFDSLPSNIRGNFLRFPIRMFTIVDYDPSEPGELFYRLNQPSTLTAAEQRNAFYGKAREQVKRLVEIAERACQWPIFGFPNTRLSYDDVITRSLYLVDAGSLRHKITSASLADKFRSGDAFSETSVRLIADSLRVIARAQDLAFDVLKLSKGGAQSWLVFLSRVKKRFRSAISVEQYAEFLIAFEEFRQKSIAGDELDRTYVPFRLIGEGDAWEFLYAYEARSASRVSDISSVLTRDIAIWAFFLCFLRAKKLPVDQLLSGAETALIRYVQSRSNEYLSADELISKLQWGES